MYRQASCAELESAYAKKNGTTPPLAACAVVAFTTCRTVGTTAAGAAIGAGIGSISGDTKNGAIVGGSVGLLSNVFR